MTQRSLAIVAGCVVGGIAMVMGYRAIASALDAATTRTPDWSVPLHAATNIVVAEGQVLVPQDDRQGNALTLQALDVATGDRQWESEHPVGKIFAVENNILYGSDFAFLPLVGTPQNALTLNAQTGQTLTLLPLANPDNEAILGAYNGAFLFSTSLYQNGAAYHEISAKTAEGVRWTFTTPPDSLVVTFASIDSILPTLHDGVLVLPILVNPQTEQRGYQIVALDAATGALLWRWETSAELTRVPVLGDAVYPSSSTDSATGELGWVKALDLRTGAERWSVAGNEYRAIAADAGEVLLWDDWYDADARNHLVVVDAQTGAEQRQFRLSRQNDAEPRTTFLRDGVIYMEDMGFGNTLSLPGLWGSAENHSWVAAFDAANGRLLWRTPTLEHSHVYQFVLTGDRLILRSNGLQPDVSSTVQGYSLP